MKTYRGTRRPDGQAAVTVEDSSAPCPLAGRQDLRNHSPDGLEWGYPGSGPSQLALALLAEHFGAGRERLAMALYQDFKFAVVARLPREGWTLSAEQIGQELCRLATDGEAHFWSRVISTLDGELLRAAIEATGKDPDPAQVADAAVQIIVLTFAVRADYARRLVADYYAGEGQPWKKMRFTRFPRATPYMVTTRKLAYARRAIQRSRDRCPLFPELTDRRSPEQRVADNERHGRLYWQDRRDTEAATWREARRELATLRPSQRAGLLRYWRQSNLPGSAVYLLGCVHSIQTRHVCFWHKLAELRRLRLIGTGRLPRPAHWSRGKSSHP